MRLTRLAPALFVILWSAGFAFVALGLPDSEPLTFLALRYAAVVGLLAVAFALLRPPLPVGRAGWLALVTGGVLVQGLYVALLYLALDLGLRPGRWRSSSRCSRSSSPWRLPTSPATASGCRDGSGC